MKSVLVCAISKSALEYSNKMPQSKREWHARFRPSWASALLQSPCSQSSPDTNSDRREHRRQSPGAKDINWADEEHVLNVMSGYWNLLPTRRATISLSYITGTRSRKQRNLNPPSPLRQRSLSSPVKTTRNQEPKRSTSLPSTISMSRSRPIRMNYTMRNCKTRTGQRKKRTSW